ncbi:MAG TPA: hypothetical protein VLE73_00990 [Candidatus Saccharimonadales bacterium]|nr:hypothetical protein [Candidatus Saccharimonadales bacterium]
MSAAPEAPAPPAPATPPVEEGVKFSHAGGYYDRFWDGKGTPKAKQVRRLENAVKDMSRGEYGQHVSDIATSSWDDNPDDPDAQPIAVYDNDFVYWAQDFKNATSEDGKDHVVEHIVRNLESGRGAPLSDGEYDLLSDKVERDLSWAASLPEDRDYDPLNALGGAIKDYRALEERAVEARVQYNEAHGKVYRGAKNALYALRGGLGLGEAINSGIAHVAGRVAARVYGGERPIDPEKVARVRVLARGAGGVAMLAVGMYASLKGIGHFHAGDVHATAADQAANPTTFADAASHTARSVNEAAQGHAQSVGDAVHGHGLPTETSPLGEVHSDGHGHVQGTVYEHTRAYAEKNGILDDLGGPDSKEFHRAVDNVLKHNNIGGPDATHSERWHAATGLDADHKITISADDFKGMVHGHDTPATTTGAEAATPHTAGGDHTAHPAEGHTGHTATAAQPEGSTAAHPSTADEAAQKWVEHNQQQRDALHDSYQHDASAHATTAEHDSGPSVGLEYVAGGTFALAAAAVGGTIVGEAVKKRRDQAEVVASQVHQAEVIAERDRIREAAEARSNDAEEDDDEDGEDELPTTDDSIAVSPDSWDRDGDGQFTVVDTIDPTAARQFLIDSGRNVTDLEDDEVVQDYIELIRQQQRT